MLEQAVRPFQRNDVVVSRGVVSTRTKLQRERARLVWGDVGTLPTPDQETDPTDPAAYNIKLEACNDTYKESHRETTTVRISQSGKPENYVDVDRIKLIQFAHQSDSKILSAYSTETTGFADTSISDDAVFGTVKKSEQCKATYTLLNDG